MEKVEEVHILSSDSEDEVQIKSEFSSVPRNQESPFVQDILGLADLITQSCASAKNGGADKRPCDLCNFVPVKESQQECEKCTERNREIQQLKTKLEESQKKISNRSRLLSLYRQRIRTLKRKLEFANKANRERQNESANCTKSSVSRRLNADDLETLHMRDNSKSGHVCLCGREFSKANNLNQHVWRLKWGRKFPCQVCPTRCFTSSDLKRHMTRIHRLITEDKRNLLCDRCGLIFSDNARLFNHHQQEHPGRSEVNILTKQHPISTTTPAKETRRQPQNMVMPTCNTTGLASGNGHCTCNMTTPTPQFLNVPQSSSSNFNANLPSNPVCIVVRDNPPPPPPPVVYFLDFSNGGL